HDRPVCFIAYTIKGFGLPLAGHKDNHAGLMTPTQLDVLRRSMHVRPGHEWDMFEGMDVGEDAVKSFLKAVPFASRGRRRFTADEIAVPAKLELSAQPSMSTQQGFGLVMHEISKSDTMLADRVVTTAPDVT